MTEHAKQNAKGFILEGETVLDDAYPCYCGYSYAAVYEDGEVKVVNSPSQCSAKQLKAMLSLSKPVAELRRCEAVKRIYAFGHWPEGEG